ncbi:unnamed protein product [Trichobilharzia regenti]|nr:unnamed protein product [Trichobilharzia regenti]
MATTVALLIGSLIKRSFTTTTTSSTSNRGKTSSLQTNHRLLSSSSKSNYQSTVTTTFNTPQIPLILPTTIYNRSVVEKNVDITPILSTNHIIHSNDSKDYTIYGDLPNHENEQAKENGEKSALSEFFPQESINRYDLMNRPNVKITSLSKTGSSYGDTNTRDECDHQLPTSTLKSMNDQCQHSYHQNQHQPHLSISENNNLYTTNKCAKLSNHKCTQPSATTTVPGVPVGARSRSISNNRTNHTSAFPSTKLSFNNNDLLHHSKQFIKKDYTHGLSSAATSTGATITPTSTLLPKHPNSQSINHYNPSNESSTYINPESIHNIINSLDQLSDKVDCMLERMNKLEDKLTNVDIDCNTYNRSKTYDDSGAGGRPTYDINRRNLNLGDLHSSDNIVECDSVFPNRKGEQKNPLPIINIPNSLSATPVTSILENTLNEAQWTSTIGRATTVSLMTTTTATKTTARTSNTSYMRPICPERYLYNDTNNELSESSCSKPKYSFELTQANVQDISSSCCNPAVSCKNIAEKEQHRISQPSPIQNPSCISSSNNHQPIRIAPTTFNPLHESYNFNKNCCKMHNRVSVALY